MGKTTVDDSADHITYLGINDKVDDKPYDTADNPVNLPSFDYNASARFWFYEIGANTLPANSRNKKPSVKWKQYEDKPIPEEIFEEWIRLDMFRDGIAVVCGKLFRGKYKGMWLNVIDCDNKLAIELLFVEGLDETAKKTIVE